MKYHHDAALDSLNTLALSAKANALVEVACDEDLSEALQWAAGKGLSVIPLGEGSNVVLTADVEALVIRQQGLGVEILSQQVDSVFLRVTAGENWHSFVQWALQHGFFGLENLALIPGTVGAAPMQNIGAYGAELESSVVAVHGRAMKDGSPISLNHSECEFSYRDSVFKHALRDQVIITAVDLELSLQPNVSVAYPALAQELGDNASHASPQQVFNAVVNVRRRKLPDPASEPNAGSFFKNPILDDQQAQALQLRFPELPAYPQRDGRTKFAAGWMIEHCGWKGFREDDQGVHPHHALVLVNYGNGSGTRLLALAQKIANSVNTEFGVLLDIEPRVYGQG
ncbi:MAG: UDP-N-acetylmuramate dehydrogenase [Halioglobus sp.]|jgi:UDP-N-acetylmuramate dehydrogenase